MERDIIVLAVGMFALVLLMFIGGLFFISAVTKINKEEGKKRGLKSYGFWEGEKEDKKNN